MDAPKSSSLPTRGTESGVGKSRDAIAGVGSSSTGGAIEGRGKIAYDPRDFEDGGSEASKMPRLTIMEEVLLLGLKDKQVRMLCGRVLSVMARSRLSDAAFHFPV
jgi:Golgi phosphoprotein 3